MIDSHCHLSIMLRGFNRNSQNSTLLTQLELQQCAQILQTATNNNVHHVIDIGTNLDESLRTIQVAQKFPNCFATIGLHPNDIESNWPEVLQKFATLLVNKQQNKIVGVGECGIDLHYPNYNLPEQQKVFHAQIQLALQNNVAIVIHSRDGDEETYKVLRDYQHEKNFKGVVHCFSSNETYAHKFLDLGLVLGVGGTLTYPKNETLRNIVKTIPLEKIILETDAPFLSPQSVRGSQNNPANIKLIAEFIANLRNESLQHVDQITTNTTRNLFGLIA